MLGFRWSNDAGGVPASVLFSPDGRRVVAAVSSNFGGLRGWESESGHVAFSTLKDVPLSAVTFSLDPENRELFVGGKASGRGPHRGSELGTSRRVNGEIGSMAWGGTRTGKHVLAVKSSPTGATHKPI